jgi:hypothetical protein
MFLGLINTDRILQCCLFQLPCFHWIGTELCASSLLYVLIMANMSEYYLYVAFMCNMLYMCGSCVQPLVFHCNVTLCILCECVATLCTTCVILGGGPDKFPCGPYI